MKIFIDDSGDFGWSKPGVSLFCAVVASDRTLDSLEAKFTAWRNRQPQSKPTGELKGKNLSQLQQVSFVNSVILTDPSLRMTLAGTRTNLFERNIAQAFIQNSADIVCASARLAEEHGKPLIADFYSRMSKWVRQRSPENVMWIYSLGDVIRLSLQHAIVLFAEEADDSEFERIELLIDRGFIGKPKELDFWREWLRNFLFTGSQRKPIATIKEWANRDHPFRRKYLRKNGIIDWTDLFRNHMTFVDSEKASGIQIADICANISYRFYSGRPKHRPYRLLRSRISGEYNTEIHFSQLDQSSLLTDAPENHVSAYSEEDLVTLRNRA